MHVLTDNEMQRFVRGAGGLGALLLVAGILGLGLWAVSLGGLLLVLAGLVVLVAVEGQELDELPSGEARATKVPPPAAAEGVPGAGGPATAEEPLAAPARAADLAAVTPAERASAPPAEAQTPATLSPWERLAMALPPTARPDPTPLSGAPAPDRTPAPPSHGGVTGGPNELEVPDRTGPNVVTFRLPRAVGAQAVAVVGEFNGWSPDAHPMVPEDDEFVACIALEPGRTYRYRYLLDGERWENDWSADAYVPNEFGGDDSLVDLRL